MLKRGSVVGRSLLFRAAKRLVAPSRLVVLASVIALASAGLSPTGASASQVKPPVGRTATAKKPSAALIKAKALARKPRPVTSTAMKSSTKPKTRNATASRAPKARTAPVLRKHGLPASLANVPVKARRWGTTPPHQIAAVTSGNAGRKPARRAALAGTRTVALQTAALPATGTISGTVIDAIYRTALSTSSTLASQTAAPLSTGTISGTVTDALTHAPLAGVCVFAYSDVSMNIPSGCTDAVGAYTIANVAQGSWFVSFEDHVNSHLGQLWNGAADWSTATYVTVTGGGAVTGINAALTQGGSVSGTITDLGGLPLAQVCASLTTTTGDYVSAGACSDAKGHFQTIGVPPGNYDVVFDDQAGPYMEQWYSGKTTQASANAVTVTLGSIRANTNAAMILGGTISGTVTDIATHAALPNICAYIFTADSNQSYAGQGCTDASGQYTSSGLATGKYTVDFSDNSGGG